MADKEPEPDDDEGKQKERLFGWLDEYFARPDPDAHIKDAKENDAETDGSGATGSDPAGGSGGRSGAAAGSDGGGSGTGGAGESKPKAAAKAQGEGGFDLVGFLVGKPKPKPS